MNEVIKAIKERRSIREFENKPVEKDKINQIIECGMWGPSAKNQQKWHFIVITNRNIIKKVSDMMIEKASDQHPIIKERAKTKKDPVLYNAPLYIIITAPEDYKWADIDGTIAAHNMVLAAHSLGLGSCYIGMVKALKDDEEFIKLIKIREGHKIVITIVFGYPKESPEPEERNKNVVTWIK